MFRTFRSRLVLLFAVAMLPAFGLIVFIAVEQRVRERDDASATALRHAQTLSLEIEYTVDSIADMLESLSLRSAVMTLSDGACSQLLASVTVNFPAYKDASFFAADTRGDIRCTSESVDPGASLVNISDRGYFRRVMAGAAFTVGEYQTGRITGLSNIVYARPIFGGGEVAGVVLASVPLEVLSQRLSEVPLSDGAVYRLLDREGAVLAASQDGETLVGEYVKKPDLASTTNGGAAIADLWDSDGGRLSYGVVPVGDPEVSGLTMVVGVPTAAATGAVDRDLVRNLGLLGLAALLAMLAVSSGSYFLVRQTRGLIADVQAYARGETRRHARREFGGVREITELHNAFDAMASVIDVRNAERNEAYRKLTEANAELERRVEERTHELNERNHRLEHEIEQRRVAEAEMERYSAQLRRMNQDLEEFTYAVSHDLKAPLRGISGFASMVMEDHTDDLDEDARGNLQIVIQSAQQMRQIIDDLLTLSRIGRIDDPEATGSVLDMVREVESEIAFTLQEKGIELRVAHDLPAIEVGHARVKQILRNLIGNAVKYNDKPNPVIEVGWLGNEPGRRTFFVRDNGIGIEERYQERIFRVFQRLDPRQETEGTGIGLTICKKAVESLGGSIWVESAPGEGSTFYFSLPIIKTEGARDDSQTESEDIAGRRQSA